MSDGQATDVPCSAGCGRPAKPAGSRGFRSSLCEECARYKVQEQTRERVRRHRKKRRWMATAVGWSLAEAERRRR